MRDIEIRYYIHKMVAILKSLCLTPCRHFRQQRRRELLLFWHQYCGWKTHLDSKFPVHPSPDWKLRATPPLVRCLGCNRSENPSVQLESGDSKKVKKRENKNSNLQGQHFQAACPFLCPEWKVKNLDPCMSSSLQKPAILWDLSSVGMELRSRLVQVIQKLIQGVWTHGLCTAKISSSSGNQTSETWRFPKMGYPQSIQNDISTCTVYYTPTC